MTFILRIFAWLLANTVAPRLRSRIWCRTNHRSPTKAC